MILIQATIKYKGYDPNLLTKGSHKKICVSCNICGRVRYTTYNNYNRSGNLCRLCSYTTPETKQKMKDNASHISGEGHPNWKGGHDKYQPHLVPIYKCIQLNQRFKGSEGHYLNKDTVIFIPKDLHKSIRHNMKTGKNINYINKIALNYLINGGL